jgi:hypothetical protein
MATGSKTLVRGAALSPSHGPFHFPHARSSYTLPRIHAIAARSSHAEWNDVLREKGILPPKPPANGGLTEEQVQDLVDAAVRAQRTLSEKSLSDCDLEELEALEDERDADAIEWVCLLLVAVLVLPSPPLGPR